MATYMAYVHGGKCRDHLAPKRDEDGNAIKQPKMFKPFWVERELTAIGLDSWCGRHVRFEKRGKRRYWDKVEEPLFPNYIFIEMGEQDFAEVASIDHIEPTFQMLGPLDIHGSLSFDGSREIIGLNMVKEAASKAYEQAQRVDENNRASVSEYKAGDALKVLQEAYSDMAITFKAITQQADDPWPMVEAEMQMLGRSFTARFDPVDVRAAE